MSKYCLLVLGGAIRDKALFRRRLDQAELLLAADSGARHLLDLGIMPEWVYGDMDSLSPEEVRRLEAGGCRFAACPAEKDDTDSAIVLKEALARGYRDIRIWGGLGVRPDHSYANIVLLQYALRPEYRLGGDTDGESPDVVMEDGDMRIFLGKRGARIDGRRGDYLSLFALTPVVTGFTHQGLKYQPADGRFASAYPLGTSNEFMEDRVRIDWDEGVLLCMHIGSAGPDDNKKEGDER